MLRFFGIVTTKTNCSVSGCFYSKLNLGGFDPPAIVFPCITAVFAVVFCETHNEN